MKEYDTIKITIKNEIGAVICLSKKAVKNGNITKAIIEYLQDFDIILEKGDTITIE